jgi:DNA-binding NarL/FixJ family response regulator
LIRVAIVADTLRRARYLAELLAEDDRLEIVEAGTSSIGTNNGQPEMIDVVVAVGLAMEHVPRHSAPVVTITDQLVEEVPIGSRVHAWLPMNSSAFEIGAAITAAANELFVMTQAQASQWLKSGRPIPTNNRLTVERITPRELQVLRMLADGLGNKEIAGQLGISDHTAKFHVAQILAKLGATSRTEAVAIGIRRGLVAI